MSFFSHRAIRHHAFALFCTFVGAWLTGVTDSMLPLALGAAVLVMTTAHLARAIWLRKRSRPKTR